MNVLQHLNAVRERLDSLAVGNPVNGVEGVRSPVVSALEILAESGATISEAGVGFVVRRDGATGKLQLDGRCVGIEGGGYVVCIGEVNLVLGSEAIGVDVELGGKVEGMVVFGIVLMPFNVSEDVGNWCGLKAVVDGGGEVPIWRKAVVRRR